MVRFRNRSISGSSYKEMSSSFGETGDSDSAFEAKIQATEKLFRALLQHNSGGKPCLHFYGSNPALMTALLDRAQELDELKDEKKHSYRKDLLLAKDTESAYTPLHWAVFQGSLASVLFLLRHALSTSSARLTQRPMNILENNCTMSPLLEAMVAAKDHEGFTPGDLLTSRQTLELLACRLSLPRPRLATRGERRRRGSFDIQDEEADEQNEFDLLSKCLQHLQRKRREEEKVQGTTTQYGCEVLTFGQAHHCALGVGNTPCSSSQQVRPQRVQTFSQSETGRSAGAVAIAAAAHHTLVATADGAVYAFGLGKGGRLGHGESVTHCPTPMRITGGSLSSRKVVGIAAAENHSMAVTSCGLCYTWGSNRFGQLSEDCPSRSTPRRVEDLKNSFCVAVAAGAKHSVALSRQGEVFVWGDNTSGQLGISRRNGTHKVQRVESLYGASPPKLAIAVEASEQATLVLTIPSGTGLPVNAIYSWGHGSHVPSRVVFDSGKSDRPVNPVAISCARYHNVAVSSDGLVYSWGLHAETLGVQQKSKKFSTSNMIASPQLVKGMLPENGGGLAVAVSASENHTAVLTDHGAMYTWGATNGKNVMGHAGVRWQPDPKRVPGVNRAVAVAAAKDHTVYLMGASFPPVPQLPEMSRGVNSLEDLAVRRIAEFMDLFNAVPLLMVAERTDSTILIDYCTEFCRRNLDGVLAVAQRSVLDAYLNELLSGSTLEVKPLERDTSYHPLLEDIVFAGSDLGPLNTVRTLCDSQDWLSWCERISKSEHFRLYLEIVGRKQASFIVRRQRSRSLSNARGTSVCSDRCAEITKNMDLSTLELAQETLLVVTKELRGVKKRLNQIAKLEEGAAKELSMEQEEKIARRSQLEADLCVFEPALVNIEKRIKNFQQQDERTCTREKKACHAEEEANNATSEKQVKDDRKMLSCDVCGIVCPDELSYTMHMNGRKHRNKVAQAKEEEEAKAAEAVTNEQVKKRMLRSERTSTQPTKNKAVWDKKGKNSFKMPHVLPPPPHGTPDSLVQSKAAPTKVSLKEIMAEESRNNSTPSPRKKPSTPSLALPLGAAPPLQSPPWASTTAKASTISTSMSPIAIPMAAKSSKDTTSFSLAEYMKSPTTSPSPKNPSISPWAKSPPTNTCTVSSPSHSNTVSFADIQQQELASKTTEVPVVRSTAMGETNKWFIERRERTGSLLDIQDHATKERETQLLIEEQLRIERMIAEENARRAKKEPTKRSCKTKSRSKKKNAADSSSGSDPVAGGSAPTSLTNDKPPQQLRKPQRGTSKKKGGGPSEQAALLLAAKAENDMPIV